MNKNKNRNKQWQKKKKRRDKWIEISKRLFILARKINPKRKIKERRRSLKGNVFLKKKQKEEEERRWLSLSAFKDLATYYYIIVRLRVWYLTFNFKDWPLS